MPRGLHQAALSISFLSPIVRRPETFLATKIASLILRPDLRFLAFTSFQNLTGPILSSGSSSSISRRRQRRSVSSSRRRPPGNIQTLSCRRLTRSTRPFFAATSFDDFAIPSSDSRFAHCSGKASIGPLRSYVVRSTTGQRSSRRELRIASLDQAAPLADMLRDEGTAIPAFPASARRDGEVPATQKINARQFPGPADAYRRDLPRVSDGTSPNCSR